MSECLCINGIPPEIEIIQFKCDVSGYKYLRPIDTALNYSSP